MYTKIMENTLLFIRIIPIILTVVACGRPPAAVTASFQSSDKNGKRVYLITHYDLLSGSDGELQHPFKQGGELTDKELSLTREQLNRVGQCLYKVSSDRPLAANTPQAFQEMLVQAEPLTREQKYVPLDRVYGELQDLRDIYGQRMPWYYNYLAIGGVMAVLNGIFDIVTHDAQAEAIEIATKYMQSDAYRYETLRLSNIDPNDFYDEKGRRLTPDEIEKRLTGWRKDFHTLNKKQHKLFIEMGRAEHKLEELFGRFIYVGRDVKIGGRSVNLNPLWGLKEKSGKKFVPLVRKACPASMSIICVFWITSVAGVVLTASVPLTYFLTGKVNAWLHREQEQRTLLDIVGDWDSFRTFTTLKLADMVKLQAKMAKLNKHGTQPCPPPNELADHYIDKHGRFY